MALIVRACLWVVAAVLTCGFDAWAGVAAGTIPGEFSVSPSGAATYTIDLDLPKGTGGFRPELQLAYDSQAGDGYLGVGWTLKGFSAISRCRPPSQPALPEAARAGDYCLDGMRLVLAQGAVGAPGSRYRTQVDSFVEVTPEGSCAGEPCSFSAAWPDGRRAHFGKIRATRADAATIIWALDQMSDRNGNIYSVEYSTNLDNDSIEYFPKKVQFGGNMHRSGAPYALKLTYVDAPPIISYAWGTAFIKSKRLDRIAVELIDADKSETISSYDLSYSVGASGRGRLSSITKCGMNNECFTPTHLEWSKDDGREKLEMRQVKYRQKWDKNGVILPGDFDGDGKMDVAHVVPGDRPGKFSINVYRPGKVTVGVGHHSHQTWVQDVTFDAPGGIFATGDFNGDGKLDIAYLYETQTTHTFAANERGINVFVLQSNGKNFNKVLSYTEDEPSSGLVVKSSIKTVQQMFISGGFGIGGRANLLDLRLLEDGTLIADMLTPSNDNGKVKFTKANWFRKSLGIGKLSTVRVVPGDFNGDGYQDVALLYQDGDKVAADVLLSNGTEFVHKSWLDYSNSDLKWNDKLEYFAIDYNGDGLADIAVSWLNSTGVVGLTSTQTGFIVDDPSRGQREAAYDAYPHAFKQPGAFVGTAKADLAYVHQVTPGGRPPFDLDAMPYGIDVYRWTGRGTAERPIAAQKVRSSTKWNNVVGVIGGDFSGHGLDEVAVLVNDPQGLTLELYSSLPDLPDKLTEIRDGLGTATTITYKTLADPAIYEVGKADSPPQSQAFISSRYQVVAAYLIRDSAGSERRFAHRYGGARMDVLEHGLLGFAWTRITDELEKSSVLVRYEQSFPYIGRINAVESTRSDGVLIAKTEYKFECLAAVFQSAASIANCQGSSEGGLYPGVYRVHMIRAISSVYDGDKRNPVLVQAKSSTYEYNKYGEPIRETDGVDGETDERTVCRNFAWAPGAVGLRRMVSEKIVIGQKCHDLDRWEPERDLLWRKFTYDGRGNLILRREWLANGDEAPDGSAPEAGTRWVGTVFSYDQVGNLVLVVDPLGRTTRQGFDSTLIFPTAKISPPAADGKPLVEKVEYDLRLGKPIAVIAPNGLRASLRYDGLGRLTSVSIPGPSAGDAEIEVVRSSYLSATGGSMVTMAQQCFDWAKCSGDGRNADTVSIVSNWPNAESRPGWATVMTETDSQGRILRRAVDQGEGKYIIAEIRYDASGRKVETTGAHVVGSSGGGVTRYQYDNDGKVSREILPNGAIRTRRHNPLNRTVEFDEHRPDGRQQSTPHRVARMEFDPLGQVRRMIDADGAITTYERDYAKRRLVVSSLGKGKVEYIYDTLGRLISERSAANGTTTYGYDAAGQLVWVRDGNGRKIAMAYDALGRLVRKSTDSALGVATFSYDEGENGRGLMTGAKGGSLSYTFAYDRPGNLIKRTADLPDLAGIYAFTWDRDPLGRIVAATYPDGSRREATYHGASGLRSASLLGPDGAIAATANFGEDALGRPASTQLGNSLMTEYGTDALGRPRSIKTVRGSTPVIDLIYEWDGNQTPPGALSNIKDLLKTGRDVAFRYDSQGRPVEVATGAGLLRARYNANGTVADLSDGSETVEFAYGVDRPASVMAMREVKADRSMAVRYDNAGMPQAAEPMNFVYDELGRPKEIRASGAMIGRFGYDPFGQHVVVQDRGNTTAWFVAPDYTVTRSAQGGYVHTITLSGPQGTVAEVTTDGAGRPASWASGHGLGGDFLQAFGSRGLPTASQMGGITVAFATLLMVRWTRRGLLRVRGMQVTAILVTAALLLATAVPLSEAALDLSGKNWPIADIPVPGTRYVTTDQHGNPLLITDANGETLETRQPPPIPTAAPVPDPILGPAGLPGANELALRNGPRQSPVGSVSDYTDDFPDGAGGHLDVQRFDRDSFDGAPGNGHAGGAGWRPSGGSIIAAIAGGLIVYTLAKGASLALLLKLGFMAALPAAPISWPVLLGIAVALAVVTIALIFHSETNWAANSQGYSSSLNSGTSPPATAAQNLSILAMPPKALHTYAQLVEQPTLQEITVGGGMDTLNPAQNNNVQIQPPGNLQQVAVLGFLGPLFRSFATSALGRAAVTDAATTHADHLPGSSDRYGQGPWREPIAFMVSYGGSVAGLNMLHNFGRMGLGLHHSVYSRLLFALTAVFLFNAFQSYRNSYWGGGLPPQR